MIKYNTLDIDIFPNHIFDGKKYLDKIMRLIILCESCLGVQVKDSYSKGFHLFIFCKKDCEICRLLFDDSRRFMMDADRPEERKNMMFDDKNVTLTKKKRRI